MSCAISRKRTASAPRASPSCSAASGWSSPSRTSPAPGPARAIRVPTPSRFGSARAPFPPPACNRRDDPHQGRRHGSAIPRPDRPGAWGGLAAAHGGGPRVRRAGQSPQWRGWESSGPHLRLCITRCRRPAHPHGMEARRTPETFRSPEPADEVPGSARPDLRPLRPSPLFSRRALRRWPDESERDENKRGGKDRDKDWEIFFRGITPPSSPAWLHPIRHGRA